MITCKEKADIILAVPSVVLSRAFLGKQIQLSTYYNANKKYQRTYECKFNVNLNIVLFLKTSHINRFIYAFPGSVRKVKLQGVLFAVRAFVILIECCPYPWQRWSNYKQRPAHSERFAELQRPARHPEFLATLKMPQYLPKSMLRVCSLVRRKFLRVQISSLKTWQEFHQSPSEDFPFQWCINTATIVQWLCSLEVAQKFFFFVVQGEHFVLQLVLLCMWCITLGM